MPARRLAALFPLLCLLLLGPALTSPAEAVPPANPVANLTVGTITQGHNQGSNQTWVVPASWDPASGATGYLVKITNVSGTQDLAFQDVTGTSQTFTTSSLADNTNYKLSVTPHNADGDGPVATADFSTIALDRTAPTGTFTVAPASAWLAPDFTVDIESATASVTITQTALSDNTPSTTITRRVLAGDGSAAQTWASGTTFKVTYTKAGTFTPQVELTDGFGNTGTVSLSAVTIGEDVTRPVVQIARPATSLRSRIAGWRRIAGTATDTGTGVEAVAVFLIEKRGGVWYAYNFGKRTWTKGRTGEIATLSHTHAMPALLTPNSLGQWHTSKIRGLTTGKISVRAFAVDGAFNAGRAPVVRQLITRR